MNSTREERIKILEEYLKEDPNDHFSRYALALEVMEMGKLEDSILLLNEVIRQNTGFLAAYYQLGRALEMDGRKEIAIQIYNQGIQVAQNQKNTKTESELKAALFSLEVEDDI